MKACIGLQDSDDFLAKKEEYILLQHNGLKRVEINCVLFSSDAHANFFLSKGKKNI